MNVQKQLKKFIQERPYLIWYVGRLDKLSEGAIVEAVLNYGNFDDARVLMKILGMPKTARLFYARANSKRSNIRPEIKNFFNLYFKKYAS